MNVLLVDDEPLVIQDIAASVCWKNLGVHRVLLAYSVSQAMEEITRTHIDLIICDVEMPHINGLQFLNWAKEHAPYAKSIILTCHPQFDYAQEAIRLNCIDYMLKPVDTEVLEQALLPVIEDLQKNTPLHVHESFWRQCADNIYSDCNTLRTAAAQSGLPAGEYLYLTILIGVTHPFSDPETSDPLIHAVSPLFSDRKEEHLFFRDSAQNLFGIFLTSYPDGGPLKDIIRYRLEDARYELPGCITALIAESRTLESAARAFSLLRGRLQQTPISCVLQLSDMPAVLPRYLSMDNNMVMDEIHRQLVLLSPEPSRRQITLLSMRRELEDWFFTRLSGLACIPSKYLPERNLRRLREKAVTAPEPFLLWIQELLDCLAKAAHESRQGSFSVSRAKEYIKQNLQMNLTRKDVAKYVFLNPDYLDRCFRNELGLSVSQYILNKKLDYAKNLLLHTDKSISDIAAAIGYNNLSSFSYMFKHETEETPMSFRRKNKSDEM